MKTFSTILIYGLLASLVLSAIILIEERLERINLESLFSSGCRA
jgi:hypothetical protein